MYVYTYIRTYITIPVYRQQVQHGSASMRQGPALCQGLQEPQPRKHVRHDVACDQLSHCKAWKGDSTTNNHLCI